MAPTASASSTDRGAKRNDVLYVRNCPSHIKKHLQKYADAHDISLGQAALDYIEASIHAGGVERQLPKPTVRARH